MDIFNLDSKIYNLFLELFGPASRELYVWDWRRMENTPSFMLIYGNKNTVTNYFFLYRLREFICHQYSSLAGKTNITFFPCQIVDNLRFHIICISITKNSTNLTCNHFGMA